MNEIVEGLVSSKAMVITSHAGFDGDGLGAALALKLALERRGAEVTVINDDPVPFYLKFLPGAEAVKRPEDVSDRAFDLGLLLDCSQFDRAGKSGGVIASQKNVMVIDHHTDTPPQNAVCFIDPEMESVCGIIYELLMAMGVSIDAKIAHCLYVGLVTDTGSFRHSNTTAQSLRLAAELVEAGVEPYAVNMELYESVKPSTLKLLGLALENLRVSGDGRIAWTTLSQSDFEKAGADETETEGIVNFCRMIGDVEVAAFLRERADGQTRATLRSKNGADVAEIARAFGGGGHHAAAGCIIERPLAEAADLLVAAIRKRLDENAQG